MAGLFHGFVCICLMLLFGVIPGSFCPASVIGAMLFAFGIGRKSIEKEGDEAQAANPLQWILLLYGMAMLLGSFLNLGMLMFVGVRK